MFRRHHTLSLPSLMSFELPGASKDLLNAGSEIISTFRAGFAGSERISFLASSSIQRRLVDLFLEVLFLVDLFVLAFSSIFVLNITIFFLIIFCPYHH